MRMRVREGWEGVGRDAPAPDRPEGPRTVDYRYVRSASPLTDATRATKPRGTTRGVRVGGGGVGTSGTGLRALR